MKRLVTLAAIVAMMALSAVGTAEAGKPTSKQNNYASQSSNASQYNNWQFQSAPKSKPMASSQWQGQSTQTQSYQGSWTSQQSGKPYAAQSAPVMQTGLSLTPKFGFDSSFGWHDGCLGEHVTQVQFGSPASQLGLEPGDAIVSVNGQSLQTANCWYNAIHRAGNQDGWVTLKILDGRSGKMAYRTANLFQLSPR